MDHKYKALLQNIPTRHVITAIAPPTDREQQIEKLRNLDINNFFILGSLTSIKGVLGKSISESEVARWPIKSEQYYMWKSNRIEICVRGFALGAILIHE